jgi:hypothetical protein
MPRENSYSGSAEIPSTTNEKPAEKIDGFVSSLRRPRGRLF